MTNRYESPLSSRYASKEMQYIFSSDKKFITWHKLWLALARAEMKLGLPITQEQLDELEAQCGKIDYKYAAEMEKSLYHQVPAQLQAFRRQCPKAAPILHLGVTLGYITDNTDIIQMREGLELIRSELVNVISRLSIFADKYKTVETLGFAHFKPAHLTTLGKRASLWINDLLMDLDELDYRVGGLQFLGTTGTQASLMELFDNDQEKCRELEYMIAEEMGFDSCVPISGQSYSRKFDAAILATLSGLAQSAGKFATDLRLLSNLKELEEPLDACQSQSFTRSYKLNPLGCERICALSSYVITAAVNPALSSCNQGLERGLDNSDNKGLSIPEAFLAVDAILNSCLNIASDIKVYDKVIARHIEDELPFLAAENILSDAAKKGGDSQELRERLSLHFLAAETGVKEQGLPNDLVSRIAGDELFKLSKSEIAERLNPRTYVGRAPAQVQEFLANQVKPVLKRYADLLSDGEPSLNVDIRDIKIYNTSVCKEEDFSI